MEAPDSIWLNPIIELPTFLGILVLFAIVGAAMWNLRWGMFLLIATVPLQRFVVIPGILGNRFTPHEAAFVSFITAALVRRGSGFNFTAPWSGPIAVPLLSLLVVGVMSLLGNPFAAEGIAELVILLYLYVLTHVIRDFSSTVENSFYVYRAWYVTATAFSLLAAYGGLLHLAGIQTFVMLGPRLAGTFFNANQAGSFILASSFMFLARITHAHASRLRKIANLGLLFCAVLGAYFTASRATLLGGGAGLLVFLFLRRVRISAIVAIAAMLIAGRFGLAAFQSNDEDASEIYNQRYSEGVDPESQSAQVRLDNWRIGVEAFARSPVVGIGIGTLWLQTPPTSGESYQVHNTYISFLGETGLLGFFALTILSIILVRECIVGMRHARGTIFEDPLTAIIPALAALGVFNIFHYGIRARHLWVTIALVLAFRRLATRHAEAPAQPSYGPVGGNARGATAPVAAPGTSLITPGMSMGRPEGLPSRPN